MVKNPVTIVAYDPAWPAEFAALAEVLHGYLEGTPSLIEHVGSTSVPGLAAKPVLDVDIVLPDERFLPIVTMRLESAGYIPEGEKGVEGRYSFKRSSVDVPRSPKRTSWPRHHLYAGTRDAPGIRDHLVFRDALRNSRELADQYAELKRTLSAQYPEDGDAYCEAKTEFIHAAMARFVNQ